MDNGFSEIVKKMAQFLPGRFYVAFLDCSGNILYSTLSAESEGTLKKIVQVFSVCDKGDFQVKKLAKNNLVVYKVSPDVVLALESYEKEGVLISAAKRVEEKYTDWSRSPEEQLPAPPVHEESGAATEKESSTGQVLEASSAEETEKIANPIPQGDKELSEIKERLEKIDNLIKKRKRKQSGE
ncbi:MAG: hypothetical protein WED07_13795 [Candidatus Freyarchaeum deiterrae]